MENIPARLAQQPRGRQMVVRHPAADGSMGWIKEKDSAVCAVHGGLRGTVVAPLSRHAARER